MLLRHTAATLLLFVAVSLSAQPWEAAVAGSTGACEPVTPIFSPMTEWLGAGPNLQPGGIAIAPAPGGRVYAAVHATPGLRWQIVEVRPDGSRTPRTASIAGRANALVVDAAGAIYVLHSGPSGSTTNWLIAFNSDGTERANHDLGAVYLFSPTQLFGWTAMDLAADQCTLFLAQRGGPIRRFNVCTGTFGADFATPQQQYTSAIRVLPDGGVIASTSTFDGATRQLERYAPDGTFVTAFAAAAPVAAMMLADGGTRLLIGESECFPNGRLVTIDPANGAVQSTVQLQMPNIGTIVSRDGWTAAIGATHVNAIPTAGTTALLGVAILLVAAALIRLR